jgi:hypothetical protein
MNSVVLPGESENHCRFCFDVYQVPVFLACGHSVCAGCARNMLDYEILKALRAPAPIAAVVAGTDAKPLEQAYEIRCPHCNDPTPMTREGGVGALKVNEPLKEAIERYLRGAFVVGIWHLEFLHFDLSRSDSLASCLIGF